jgi:hypothetical protein
VELSSSWLGVEEEGVSLTQRGDPAQQLGRIRERERAGSIGRAGRSRAGPRLLGFFIGKLLLTGSSNTAATLIIDT